MSEEARKPWARTKAVFKIVGLLLLVFVIGPTVKDLLVKEFRWLLGLSSKD